MNETRSAICKWEWKTIQFTPLKGKKTNDDLQNITQKTKDEQNDPHKKPGVNSCALEGYAFPAPLVALVVLV